MRRIPIYFALLLGGLMLAVTSGCAGGNPNISAAESNLEEQNYEQALQNVEEALQQDSANAQAYLLKGRILFQQAGQVEDPQRHRELVQQAVEAWNRAIEVNPEVRGQVQTRELFAFQREFQRGADAFNAARADTANVPQAELYERAAAYFGSAAVIAPDSARASRFQAYAYVNAGTPEAAIEPLQDLVEIGAADTTDYTLLGQLYLQSGQAEQAVEVLEAGDEAYPGSAEIQSLLLNAYAQAGMMDRAQERYAQLVEEEPNNKIYRYNYGSLLLEAERYDEAIEQLSAAVELDPSYANAQYNLGAAYTNKAVDLSERLRALRDSLAENRAQLSQEEVASLNAEIEELTSQRQELFAQAIPPLERARELAQSGQTNVNASQICRALFTAYVQTGQQEEARAVQECAGM